MKVSILRENLYAAVVAVKRFVPKKARMPGSDHVLLATDNGQLVVTGTDLTTSVSIPVGAQVHSEGGIMVPISSLAALSVWPDERIEIAVERNKATFTCGKLQLGIVGRPAEDFPPTPSTEDDTRFEVSGAVFRAVLGRILSAASTDDVRPALTGLLFEEDGGLRITAADGFVLATESIPTINLNCEDRIIPAKALKKVVTLLPKKGHDPVTISLGLNPVFQIGDTVITTTAIQTSFPNYKQLIPDVRRAGSRAKINISELARAVKTLVPIASKEAAGVVRLVGEGDILTLSAKDEEIGEQSVDIAMQLDGESFKVAFNYRHLVDLCKTIPSETVDVALNSPSDPGTFRATNSSDHLRVVMPIFIQW